MAPEHAEEVKEDVKALEMLGKRPSEVVWSVTRVRLIDIYSYLWINLGCFLCWKNDPISSLGPEIFRAFAVVIDYIP